MLLLPGVCNARPIPRQSHKGAGRPTCRPLERLSAATNGRSRCWAMYDANSTVTLRLAWKSHGTWKGDRRPNQPGRRWGTRPDGQGGETRGSRHPVLKCTVHKQRHAPAAQCCGTPQGRESHQLCAQGTRDRGTRQNAQDRMWHEQRLKLTRKQVGSRRKDGRRHITEAGTRLPTAKHHHQSKAQLAKHNHDLPVRVCGAVVLVHLAEPSAEVEVGVG
jgi:hypothetical protein